MVKYLLFKLLSAGLSYMSETDTLVQAVAFTAPIALTCSGVAAVTGQSGACEERSTADFYTCHTAGECSATDGERKRWIRLVTGLGTARTFVYPHQDGTATVYTLDASGTGIVTSVVET